MSSNNNQKPDPAIIQKLLEEAAGDLTARGVETLTGEFQRRNITTAEGVAEALEVHRKVNPHLFGPTVFVSTPGSNPPPPPPKPPVEYGSPAMELYWTGRITPKAVNMGSGIKPTITPTLKLEAANNPDSAIAAALRATRKRKGSS